MNEFERQEAKKNQDYKPSKSMRKATWIYTALIIALFLVVNFGIDPLKNAVVNSLEGLLWWESMFSVSIMLVCAIALWVFYFIKLVKQYKEKNALPPKFWSAWGITKKVIAVLLTILVVFIFTKNLVNTVKDVNTEEVLERYSVTKITSETDELATFDYVVIDGEDAGESKTGTCYLYEGVDLTCNEFEFRRFKNSGMLIAIRKVA